MWNYEDRDDTQKKYFAPFTEIIYQKNPYTYLVASQKKKLKNSQIYLSSYLK